MSNLTAAQLTAITTGQPVRQVWKVKAPVLADHSAYTETVIDDGIWAYGSNNSRRVIKAGSRKHKVWNPHPMADERPQAVRYSIECANDDGFFHRRSGSCWNPFGIYDASPSECYLMHSIFVWDAVTKAWLEIEHMRYIGQVVSVEYTGAASMLRSGTTAAAVAARGVATITSEQDGAWSVLRHVFNKEDGVTDLALDTYGMSGTFLALASINPVTRAHGDPGFTLDCNGFGFTADSYIFFNNVAKATTYTSSILVSAAISAAEIATAGSILVKVYRPGPAGGSSNTKTFTVT